MEDQLLQILTQGALGALAVRTLVDVARHRDRARLEVAALFASLGLLLLSQAVRRVTGFDLPGARTAGALILIAQPYLLLRLVRHFRPVPRAQRALALGAAALSAAAVAAGSLGLGRGAPREALLGVLLAVILAFVYVQGYASAALFASAAGRRGVRRRRAAAAGVGSACFAAVIFLLGVRVLVPPAAVATEPLTSLLGAAAVLAYYVAFAPPRWLRRTWQMEELRRFTRALSGRSAEDRHRAALDIVASAAARAVGGAFGVTAVLRGAGGIDGAAEGTAAAAGGGALVLHADSHNRAVLERLGLIDHVVDTTASPFIARALRESALCTGDPSQWGQTLRRLAPAVDRASSALLVPLATIDRRYGVVVVLLEGGPLFVEDDLALLAMLAEQAALAIQVTEELRRQNEALARAKAEADRASRAKSEFLSRMSHELRTPLGAVLGFAQLLELDTLTDEQRESVAHILKAGRHLLDLINEVLDIARIEAARLSLSPEPVLVQDVLRETAELVAPMAAQRRIRLDAGLSAPAGAYVHADAQRLKQVLLNLLSNAIKYNRDGGEVALWCAPSGDGMLRLAVRDTGPGIAAALRDRLFVPFERIGADQTDVEGTGLGLALSERLVGAMGGRIGVDSEVGRGSTFWIELPACDGPLVRLPADAAGGDSGAPADPPADGPRRTVLYVEDNLSNLTLVKRVLARRPNVRLIPAMQGAVGLELARQHAPDLVLLDLHLPDMRGELVLQRLRLDPATAGVPVIVVSADATPGQVERLLASGAHAYLTKPLDITAFLRELDGALEGGGVPAPAPPPVLPERQAVVA